MFAQPAPSGPASTDPASELEAVEIPELDMFEKFCYSDLIGRMTKAKALQIIINNAEGDYSQLSPQLAQIARNQDQA